MHSLGILGWLIFATAPQRAAVVALADTSAVQLRSAAEALRAQGYAPLDEGELLERLTGSAKVRLPDEGALAAMLQDAREREARFDGAGAQALRSEVTRAFDECLRPSDSLRRLAAAALQDAAALQLADGRAEAAAVLAKEALRRFADVALDTRRHGPAVQELFKAATRALASDTATLTIDSDQLGELYAEGRHLGAIAGRLQVELPVGTYRLWLQHAGGTSLPYPVRLGPAGAALHIDSALEEQLELTPHVRLRCVGDCETALAKLCARLAVDRCEAASSPERPASAPKAEAALSAEIRSPPGAWLVVPFGVGQWSQGRRLIGSAFLAGELALLSWHGYSLYQDMTLSRQGAARAEGWRQQRNLSAGLVWAGVVAGVAEALAYEALSPAAAGSRAR
jgi:hypothetical protein